jgi:tmRNA-binding protein
MSIIDVKRFDYFIEDHHEGGIEIVAWLEVKAIRARSCADKESMSCCKMAFYLGGAAHIFHR